MQTLRIVCERWKNKLFNEWDEDDLKDALVEIETGCYTPKRLTVSKGFQEVLQVAEGRGMEVFEAAERGEEGQEEARRFE